MSIEQFITHMDWINWTDADEDEDDKSVTCRHVWEKTGVSPVHGDVWYNCKLCQIPKEECE